MATLLCEYSTSQPFGVLADARTAETTIIALIAPVAKSCRRSHEFLVRRAPSPLPLRQWSDAYASVTSVLAVSVAAAETANALVKGMFLSVVLPRNRLGSMIGYSRGTRRFPIGHESKRAARALAQRRPKLTAILGGRISRPRRE